MSQEPKTKICKQLVFFSLSWMLNKMGSDAMNVEAAEVESSTPENDQEIVEEEEEGIKKKKKKVGFRDRKVRPN